MARPHLDMDALIARQQAGFSLSQAFYRDEHIFQQDMETVFHHEWQLVGHVSELTGAGAYFTYEIGVESVIVVRDQRGEIHALANVCRHRGSRVCLERRGHARRFVCPYHAWTYELDGQLVNARLMEQDMDPETWGLKKIALKIFHGLIYISFAQTPDNFDVIEQELTPEIAAFDLANTRIAHRASYPVRANWKLLVENYSECYHCAAAHPEFSRSHTTHMPANRVSPLNAEMAARSAACGASTAHIDRIGSRRPANSPEFAYNRYALHKGFYTGSEDGKPLAPLLGSLSGFDGGASDVYVGLLNPMLVYCDHAVVYRFIPVDVDNSIQEVIWLVRGDAEVGKDYDVENLTWLWDVTTIADKKIIEKNQEGVNSRYYQPGPFAPMEQYAQRFVESYLSRLR